MQKEAATMSNKFGAMGSKIQSVCKNIGKFGGSLTKGFTLPIISGGAAIDFENEVSEVATSETAILPWDATATAVINLSNAVTANSTHPLFLALGVEFYQQVNGQMYPLKNGAFNALSLVKVDGGA
jgi:hypothetical protein